MANGNADVQIIVDLIDKTKGKIQKTFSQIDKEGRTTISTINSMDKQFAQLDKTQRVLDRTLGKTSHQFQGWAMSMMFFGMALQRTFNTIWRESTKTFQDVMHSVDGTVTGFDIMKGSLDFLKFTAGEALEPIATFLVPIIDKITDWISNNQELFRTLLLITGVLGTAFAAGGAMVLAVNGFIELAEKVSIFHNKSKALGGFDWAGLGAKIQKGIGIVAVGFSIFLAKQAIDEWNSGETLKAALKGVSSVSIAAGGIMLLKGKGAGGALIAAGVALDLVAENKFFGTMARTLGILSALMDTWIDAMSFNMKQMFEDGIIMGVRRGLKKIFQILGVDHMLEFFGMSPDILEKLAPERKKFDFTSSFENNMADIIGFWDNLDSKIAASIDKAQALSNQKNAPVSYLDQPIADVTAPATSGIPLPPIQLFIDGEQISDVVSRRINASTG